MQQFGQVWLMPLWQRLAAVRPERWRRLAVILCAVWVLANLARLVWLLLPLHAAKVEGAAPVNAMVAQSRRPARAAVDIDALVGWHLFGEVGAEPRAAGAAGIEEQAQNTSLNLQLLGLANASEPGQARAIILAEGRQQQFAIGEQVPGSGKVVLSKVLDDRVILDNNGRYETLWLYDPNGAQPPPRSSTPPQAPEAPPVASQPAPAPDSRLYNPPNLSQVIQVAPANEKGKLIGYRVRPGRDAERFAQFGFKPGDVVTSINGVSLNDPQRALELYNTMRTQSEATFTVKRKNGDVNLTVSLENKNGIQE